MTKKTPELETEFAYHRSRLQLIEESRSALENIDNKLDSIDDLPELRMVASEMAKTSLERSIEIFDYALLALLHEARYKKAIAAFVTLFFLALLSNLIVGSIAFYLGSRP